jgi:hypothetical protein
MPIRPIAGLPDVYVITAIHAEIMCHILRTCKLFSAIIAVIDSGYIRRYAGKFGWEVQNLDS